MARKNVLTSTWSWWRKASQGASHAVRLALRKAKLQILPQLTKWKGDREEPKVVIYKNRGIALLDTTLTHLVPLGGVVTLLVLNINTFYIGNLSTTAATAFQFAAKLLELFMQASLAVILLDAIRWQIVRSQDLPLGGLTAPLRVTDVSYLWSLEFWGSLTSKSWRGYRKAYLGLLIFATIVLAALVGPSGAVAIVPRQITHSSAQYLNIMNPADNLFPHTVSYLDAGSDFAQAITQISEFYGTGLYQLLDADGVRQFGTPSGILGLPWSSATLPSRHMSYMLRTQGENLVRSVEGPSNILTMRTSQALVQCACSENDLYDLEHNKTYLSFPNSDPHLNKLITWGETLGNVTDDGETILIFTNLPASASSRSSVLMVLATTAPIDRSYVATASACIIDATWTSVTLNTSQADGFNQINYVLETHYDGSIPQAQMIDFPKAWTDHVRSTILASQPALTLLESYPEQIFALALANSDIAYLKDNGLVLEQDNDGDPNTKDLFRYLDKIHAWSRYAAISIDIDENNDLSTPSSLTYQTISQLLQGYGYNAEDITVQLSLAVLGVFCVFVVTHIFLLLLTGYTGTSWDSISELLMLGLMSRKPEQLLGPHASVGLETLKTFREPVSVRVNDAGGMELVFANDAGGKGATGGDVVINKAY